MSTEGYVPVVDFAAYSLGVEKNGVSAEDYANLAQNLYDAFSTVGFVYLKNHGIPQKQVDDVMSRAAEFFTLPVDVKRKYVRGGGLKNHGWVRIEGERLYMLAPERPGDLKECYDLNPHIAESWPDEEVPGFQPGVKDMYSSCRLLASRILELMAVGLDLPDPDYFNKRHRPDEPTYTQLRCLYYPAVSQDTGRCVDKAVKPEQIRCGEHTDYGSMTLLFQDDAGGLQVWNRVEERYLPAPPIPGTIIINLGDLMQRWTGGKLLSTKHRVMLPTPDHPRPRQSIACFVHPEEDCLVECVDGSNKYPPIRASDHFKSLLDATLELDHPRPANGHTENGST